MAIDAHETVARLAVRYPQLIEVFERYGIDYCCGGEKTLADSCRESGVSLDELSAALQAALATGHRPSAAEEEELAKLSPDALCDHIVERHHRFLRASLPRLSDLITRTRAAHEPQHPELRELEEVFRRLRSELEQHMMKEELVLFPAVKELVASRARPGFPFGTVRNPIGVMEQEHQHAAAALRRMRALTHGYRVPEDACPTYAELLRRLEELERDLHVHIHKENNVLFPAVVALEARLGP